MSGTIPPLLNMPSWRGAQCVSVLKLMYNVSRGVLHGCVNAGAFK
jgi:hypothetical protein